jgi:hypothetical protein
MSRKIDTVSVVFKQTDLGSFEVTNIFREKKDAEKFCNDQNELNQPEFDDYGYYEGIYHSFQEMKVE